jgi:hypothetical protein
MVGTAIGAVTSIGGSLISKKSSDKAEKAHTQAADEAAKVQKEMYDTTRADLAPYRQTGQAANTKLSALMGLDTFDRDAIRERLIRDNPTLFGNLKTASTGGVGMAGTVDGREALGRDYAAQQAARPGAFREGWSDTNINQFTPEDFAGIGEFAGLSANDRFIQEKTGGTARQKLSEIINKYRM